MGSFNRPAGFAGSTFHPPVLRRQRFLTFCGNTDSATSTCRGNTDPHTRSLAYPYAGRDSHTRSSPVNGSYPG